MEIINIFLPYCRDGSVILTIKYNSGKCGNVQVKDGEIINFPLGDKVKTAVKSLIKKNSYAWLKTKYYEISRKRQLDDDIEFLFEAFTDHMEELKNIQKELKKLYIGGKDQNV